MHIRKCSRAQTDKGIGSDRPEWLGRAQMSTSLSPLLAPMLSSAAMRAVCDDAATLQNMLDFEAALARAEAALGVIPASAAGPITNACRAESFDLAALAEAATRSGNLAIPLVKALTANVAKVDAEAARYVHWGATSQDVIDTGAMLGLRAGIDALLADINRAIAGFAGLARQHRHTPVVARTWLQHALPMPFGLKLAEYAAALHRSKLRLQRLRRETLALQFGGAAGTLAALGDKGLPVAERLAEELEAAAARRALAHPPRPHRGSGLRVRHHRRHLRQDRARRFADDADRCRRSVRALRRRPRRLLHHAAQAQSRRGGQRAGGGHHGAQSRGDDLCGAGAGP